MKLGTPLLMLIIVPSISFAFTELPKFKGYYTTDQHVRCLLKNPNTQESSGWLSIGQRFMGYELVDLDPKYDRIYLAKGNRTFELTLEQHKRRSAPLTTGKLRAHSKSNSQTWTVEQYDDDVRTLSLPTGARIQWRTSANRDGTITHILSYEEPGAAGHKAITAAPTIVANPEQPFSLQFDDWKIEWSPQI